VTVRVTVTEAVAELYLAIQDNLRICDGMDTSGWQTQLRKGAAELVALALLSRGEMYGLELLSAAERAGPLLSAGSLYPLLNRLESEGKVVSRWVTDGEASHPRKYYRLTDDGTRLLVEMRAVWSEFRDNITTIVEGTPCRPKKLKSI
jgi:PadR family transcriptional regulator PadR